MAIYTLSINYIDGVGGDQSHLYNVFLKFSNPSCEHKAAMDKNKKLLSKYISASATNVDLQTWLDWMSRKKETHFEIIDVNIPENITDEEMYLIVASATNPQKKVIVSSHQYWQNFEYINGCNKIKYRNNEVTILDKEEALNELISLDNKTNNISIINNMDKKNNPWQSGSFYLFAFIAIVLSLTYIATLLPIYTLPITIIAALLALSILGAFQLKNDKQLSDKSFITLMGLSLKQLPFIRSNDNFKKSN